MAAKRTSQPRKPKAPGPNTLVRQDLTLAEWHAVQQLCASAQVQTSDGKVLIGNLQAKAENVLSKHLPAPPQNPE
jgi:hypothetical protein